MTRARLRLVDHRNPRDVPAVVLALDLELDHRDRVRRAAHDAQPATDALLLIDDHVRAALPASARDGMQGIALHHARQALHADAVVGADVHTPTAQDADRG